MEKDINVLIFKEIATVTKQKHSKRKRKKETTQLNRGLIKLTSFLKWCLNSTHLHFKSMSWDRTEVSQSTVISEKSLKIVNNKYMSSKQSHSVMSDSLQPHGLWPTRLRPWDFPGKNTGVGCHFLLQGIFRTQISRTAGRCFTLSHQGSPNICQRVS